MSSENAPCNLIVRAEEQRGDGRRWWSKSGQICQAVRRLKIAGQVRHKLGGLILLIIGVALPTRNTAAQLAHLDFDLSLAETADFWEED